MARLDKEKEIKLEPRRMIYAKQKLEELGYEFIERDKEIIFTHKNEPITFYPYTGWATGKSIKDGRGILNLIKQLKN